jgi:hypothetical protein
VASGKWSCKKKKERKSQNLFLQLHLPLATPGHIFGHLEGGKRPQLTTFATFATPGRTMGHLEGGKRRQATKPFCWDLANCRSVRKISVFGGMLKESAKRGSVA